MLTIWGRLNSHNVKKVAWLADEIDIPYVRHDIGGQFGFTDAYRAMNPNALIPTIEEDGMVLWESNAILRYLAARHAPDRFWPEDPAVRARADQWMDWQFSYGPAQYPAFFNLVRRPAAERDLEAIAQSAQATAKMMTILDQALAATSWLSGESFGLGDIPMGVYAHTWFTIDIPRPTLPHVEDWYRRLVTRPGYAANVMIPLT